MISLSRRSASGVIALAFFSIFGCASSRLSIVSTPSQADVKIYNHDTQAFEKVASTPVKLKSSGKILKKFRRPYVFSIEKAGYLKEKIIIDKDTSRLTTLKLKLERNLANQRQPQRIPFTPAVQRPAPQPQKPQGADPDFLSRDLLEINRYVNTRQFKLALTRIDRLIRKYPKASVFWDMKGSVHLLQGNKSLAISAYQRALRLNPSSYETRAVLENLGGGRS